MASFHKGHRKFKFAFYREIKEKDEKLSSLERSLEEAVSLANRELVQKAEMELKSERDRREQLESSLASLQLSLQTKEMQYSE